MDRSAAYAARCAAKNSWPRAWPAVPGRAGLRHRRGPSGECAGGHLRHRHGGRRQAGAGAVGKVFDLRPPPSSGTWTCAGPSTSKLAAYGHIWARRTWRDLGEKLTAREALKAAAEAWKPFQKLESNGYDTGGAADFSATPLPLKAPWTNTMSDKSRLLRIGGGRKIEGKLGTRWLSRNPQARRGG